MGARRARNPTQKLVVTNTAVVLGSARKSEEIQLLVGYASVQTTERYLDTKQDLVHVPDDGIKLKVGLDTNSGVSLGSATMAELRHEITRNGGRGYIYLAASGCRTLKVPVESADMASAVFQRYRDENGIGASDLKQNCGNIYASDGKLVARVSYNGRIWDPQGQLLQERS